MAEGRAVKQALSAGQMWPPTRSLGFGHCVLGGCKEPRGWRGQSRGPKKSREARAWPGRHRLSTQQIPQARGHTGGRYSLTHRQTNAGTQSCRPRFLSEGPGGEGFVALLLAGSPCVSRSRAGALGCVTTLPCLGRGLMAAQMSKAWAPGPQLLRGTLVLMGGGPGQEAPSQHFWGLHYEDAEVSPEAWAWLRELCLQWLQPAVPSQEQVLGRPLTLQRPRATLPCFQVLTLPPPPPGLCSRFSLSPR